VTDPGDPRLAGLEARSPFQPIPLATNELRVDDLPVTGDVDGIGSTDREHPIKGCRPGRHIGIGVDCGVGGLLHKVTGEHHDPSVITGGTRRYYDQVRSGVATAQVGDRYAAVAEVDDGVVDPVVRGRNAAIASSISPAFAP
jgi:hypothetical protein